MRWAAWLAVVLAFASAASAQQLPEPARPWEPVNGDARPHFTTVLAPGVAPAAIHVDATACPLAVGTPLTARYAWDFGDPRGKYNQLVGFVAAHVYDRSGTYAITLTVTDEAGHRASTVGSVTILPDTRWAVFVSPDGNDGNNGLTEATPLRSAAAAFGRLAGGRGRADPGHLILLFKAGGTYPVTDALTVRGPDVVVGRYGVGDRPVLMLLRGPVDERGHGPRGGISVDPKCDGVMIEHLAFASPYHPNADGSAPKVGLQAIFPRGRNVAVRECSFKDVDDAVNCNGNPTGLLVQDCDALGETDLRGYMIWGQGTDHAYIGNRVANSTREHNVRMTAIRRVLICGNDFANPDRSKVDPGDGTKGCIECHFGSWEYITGNHVTWGPIRTGPRGGVRDPVTTTTEWVVVDGNDLTNAQIRLDPGSHHVMVRNNVQRNGGNAFVEIDPPDDVGRVSGDLTVAHNTGIDSGTSGVFVRVWGRVDGLAVADNLFVAPQLHAGTASGAVNVNAGGLSGFTAMSHDVWPVPATFDPGSEGGVCVLMDAGFGHRRNYLTAAEWAATRPVDGDRFVPASPMPVDDRGIPIAGGPADGAAVPFPGTAFDHDGRPRPAGPQVAGAFEQTSGVRGSMPGR
jgi:hypothetical protein